MFDKKDGIPEDNGNGIRKKILAAAVCTTGALIIAAGIVAGVMKFRGAGEENKAAVETEKPLKKEKPEDTAEKVPEATDLKTEESEPEPEFREYILNYREAYQGVVNQTVNTYGNGQYLVYSVYDMEGDGIPELFMLAGTGFEDFQWKVYSYDITSGEAYQIGQVTGYRSTLYRTKDGTPGVTCVSTDPHLGQERIYSVKRTGRAELSVNEIWAGEMGAGEDYYAAAASLTAYDAFDTTGLSRIQGETVTIPTGLISPGGKEVFLIPGDVIATSVLQEAGYSYSTSGLTDLNSSTVWAEGIDGGGAGETIVYDLGLPCNVDGIAVLPGYCKNEESYRANGRPVKITVKCGDKILSKDLKDFRPDFQNPMNNMIYFDLGETIYTDRCTVMLSRVQDGEKYTDTCITEMFPYSYSQ